jgi:hypothetical protein
VSFPSAFRRNFIHVNVFFLSYLLEYDAINQPIKNRKDDARCDDGGEVEEHEIIVFHFVRKVAFVASVFVVPTEKWQESNDHAEYPAETYDTFK